MGYIKYSRIKEIILETIEDDDLQWAKDIVNQVGDEYIYGIAEPPTGSWIRVTTEKGRIGYNNSILDETDNKTEWLGAFKDSFPNPNDIIVQVKHVEHHGKGPSIKVYPPFSTQTIDLTIPFAPDNIECGAWYHTKMWGIHIFPALEP